MRILYLDLDTTRPDHLGCYGYHRNTSPNLDKIAAEGVRFDNYYCSDAPCLPSRTALMTGKYGIHTGVVNHGGTAADPKLEGATREMKTSASFTSLPKLLRTAGLKTALISPFAERHSTYTYYSGFLEMYNTGKSGQESAEDVTPTVLDWIDRNGASDDWYLQVNYWDPHSVFRAPDEFGNPFKDEPIADWYTPEVLESHQQVVGPHTACEVNMYNDHEFEDKPRHVGAIKTMDDLKKHIDGYDCGIRYMDDHVGMLMAALEKQGVLEDLIIIISADHGENHGELGIYSEHGTADHITCRIPMIVRWPGQAKAGHVDSGLRHNIDLAPTLLEMLQDRIQGQEWITDRMRAAWDGQSFAKALRGQPDDGKPYAVISQCAHVCQRGVRFGPWMYIRTYHDGFRLFPKEMLFNLDTDPHEQHNLAEEKPEICREAVYYLNEWHDEMMEKAPDAVDPLWTTMKEKGPLHAWPEMIERHNYFEHLRNTGRGWAVDEIKKRHPDTAQYD